jgi:Tol biopolymer transport system component
LLLAGATLPAWADCAIQPTVSANTPIVSGQLVYQSLIQNAADASSVFLYDFAKNVHANLSAKWTTVTNARNPHFSPIDRWIVFTAVKNNRFSIFAWNPLIDEPIELTPASSFGVSEDASFTPDGKHIVFKNDGDIWVMSLVRKSATKLKGKGAKALTTGGSLSGTYTEASAPVASADNREIVFFRGSGEAEAPAQLYRLTLGPDFSNPVETPIPKAPDAYEYYPRLTADGTLFFARHTTEDAHDMIMRQLPGQAAEELATNTCGADNSDPAPLDKKRMFFSRFDPVEGRYKLQYATIGDGRVFKLKDRNINNVEFGWVTGADYKP